MHRRGPIDPRDVRRKGSIPVTSVDLVLVHLSPELEPIGLERMLVASESLGLLKRGRLAELVEARRGRPGIAKLATLIGLQPLLALELLFLPVWRMAGLPRPLVNHPVAVPSEPKPLIVDLVWPDLKMVVELDSQRFHGDWERAAADRERDQELALAGSVCHRFVRRLVAEDPTGTAARLRRLAEVRRAELGR